jgi:hypothetical protein
VVDKLDKVLLERSADINPDLLHQIQEAAMEEQKQQHQNSMMLSSTSNPFTFASCALPPALGLVESESESPQEVTQSLCLAAMSCPIGKQDDGCCISIG